MITRDEKRAILLEAFETKEGTKIAYEAAARHMAPGIQMPDPLEETPEERAATFHERLARIVTAN